MNRVKGNYFIFFYGLAIGVLFLLYACGNNETNASTTAQTKLDEEVSTLKEKAADNVSKTELKKETSVSNSKSAGKANISNNSINFAKPVNEQEGYDIKIQFKNVKNQNVYLAHHFGKKQFVKDTAKVSATGFAQFKSDKFISGGLYLIVLESKNYFEIILNEKPFEIAVDTTDMLNKVSFKNSKENEVFFQDLKFIQTIRKEANQLSEKKKQLQASKQKTSDIDKALKAIGTRVKNYRAGLMQQNPNTFYTKLIQASTEVEVPDPPKNADGTIDSTFQYKYYKKHYLDGVDFSDSRLLNTPILHNKMTYYLDKLTVQIPDSISKEIKWIVDKKVKNNQDVFKYVVNHATSTYEKSKVVGMDAVFVEMAETYYNTGKVYWAEDSILRKIKDRARSLKPLLIGKTAPNMTLKDKDGNWQEMHKIDKDITILYFWEPDCGHCKKATPKLKEFWDKYKEESVMIYAACTEVEKEKWLKYIKDNELDWINVGDFELRNYFREHYDIYSTPVIYLLNKDKVIKVKKIAVEQLDRVYQDMRDGKIK